MNHGNPSEFPIRPPGELPVRPSEFPVLLGEQAVRDALTSPKKAKKAAGFLRGQVMRISKGQADPNLVGRLIEKKLAEAGQE